MDYYLIIIIRIIQERISQRVQCVDTISPPHLFDRAAVIRKVCAEIIKTKDKLWSQCCNLPKFYMIQALAIGAMISFLFIIRVKNKRINDSGRNCTYINAHYYHNIAFSKKRVVRLNSNDKDQLQEELEKKQLYTFFNVSRKNQ